MAMTSQLTAPQQRAVDRLRGGALLVSHVDGDQTWWSNGDCAYLHRWTFAFLLRQGLIESGYRGGQLMYWHLAEPATPPQPAPAAGR